MSFVHKGVKIRNMAAKDFMNFAQNIWWVTYRLFQSLHIVLEHLSAQNMAANFEGTFVSDLGLQVILYLVVQDCQVCQRNRKVKKKARKRK